MKTKIFKKLYNLFLSFKHRFKSKTKDELEDFVTTIKSYGFSFLCRYENKEVFVKFTKELSPHELKHMFTIDLDERTITYRVSCCTKTNIHVSECKVTVESIILLDKKQTSIFFNEKIIGCVFSVILSVSSESNTEFNTINSFRSIR